MRIIADENINRAIIKMLIQNGYDVFSIQDHHPGFDDAEIVKQFSDINAIIITQDKDFGDLTFLKNINTNTIILLRFNAVDINLMIDVLINFLKENLLETLRNKFIVLTPFKKRFRNIPN